MKKTAIVIIIFISFGCSSLAQAKTDKVKVQQAMMDYLEGFYNGDTIKIIRSVSPAVTKYGYWKENPVSPYAGEPMSYKQIIDEVIAESKKSKKRKMSALEKTEVFEVQDQTASGKVTAWWGTDYILLEKANDKWVIRMVLWQGPLKK